MELKTIEELQDLELKLQTLEKAVRQQASVLEKLCKTANNEGRFIESANPNSTYSANGILDFAQQIRNKIYWEIGERLCEERKTV